MPICGDFICQKQQETAFLLRLTFFSLKDDWLLLLILLMKNTSLILTGSNLQVVGECWNNITSLKCRLTSANRKTSAAKARITNMSAKRNVTVIKIKVSGLQTNGSSVGHNCQMYYALTSFHLSSKVSPVPCGCQRPIQHLNPKSSAT